MTREQKGITRYIGTGRVFRAADRSIATVGRSIELRWIRDSARGVDAVPMGTTMHVV